MIYLDSGATSFRKPRSVYRAVQQAMVSCASPGRGGYGPAMEAARQVYRCREKAGALFRCQPEQVVVTNNCTHGLNIAIHSLIRPGKKVVTSGFEHNAVTRCLHALDAEQVRAGQKLFDWEDTLSRFEDTLKQGAEAAVFTHVSNVFGYILPVAEMAAACRRRGVPFILDAAQSAGVLDVDFEALGADFVAMPGHKGLMGPQGTGLLLCRGLPRPLHFGGTGSESKNQAMPAFLPDRLEAGTMNVPGCAGLAEGMDYVLKTGTGEIFRREHRQLVRCAGALEEMGMQVFQGDHQAGTVSFIPGMDCEEAAELLANQGIAVRAGYHCAPQAHESAGTLETGTVRVSFGFDACDTQTDAFLKAAGRLLPGCPERRG